MSKDLFGEAPEQPEPVALDQFDCETLGKVFQLWKLPDGTTEWRELT